ncbi:NAD(P)/FAD-dependent oxidoreductase [Planktotalea sp.]|uniref:NAD(P)/FAD-dependent oxidoreductase n=1 Tax=Planktotalea sp. TaxID=2029877 RepID=UPI003D6A561D
MGQHYDIAVIGAGIAGASIAARLAQAGKRVALFEMESQPGYHTTGRSAAVFAPSYGPAPIRALTRASEAFFRNPPKGFCEAPLFSNRKIMMLARADQSAALEKLVASVESSKVSVISEADARKRNPLIRAGYTQNAMLDEAGQDIDVGALHQGFLRMFKEAGGTLFVNAAVRSLSRADAWLINAGNSEIKSEVVVNAAGAWADKLGEMAGAETIGLTPKRRTAVMIAAPDIERLAQAPITIDVDEQFYLKPDAGKLLISPADETPSEPCDAQPEEIDVAIGVDRIETAFDLNVRRIESKWAGLRSFVQDKAPVAGFSDVVDAFYWLAGQGGYGIQSAPALSDFAAANILGRACPDYIESEGFSPSDVGVARLAER